MTYVPICPKCGSTLICRSNGVCWCPTCQEIYYLMIRGVKNEYKADTA